MLCRCRSGGGRQAFNLQAVGVPLGLAHSKVLVELFPQSCCALESRPSGLLLMKPVQNTPRERIVKKVPLGRGFTSTPTAGATRKNKSAEARVHLTLVCPKVSAFPRETGNGNATEEGPLQAKRLKRSFYEVTVGFRGLEV